MAGQELSGQGIHSVSWSHPWVQPVGVGSPPEEIQEVVPGQIL